MKVKTQLILCAKNIQKRFLCKRNYKILLSKITQNALLLIKEDTGKLPSLTHDREFNT